MTTQISASKKEDSGKTFVYELARPERKRAPSAKERARLKPEPWWYVQEIRERTARMGVTCTIDVHAALTREIKDLADKYLTALGASD